MDVSVVIPAYNEEGNVEQLYKELRTVLGKLRKNYELIFIDDGSSDSTLDKLRSLRKKDKKVKVISFQRNFGKAAALTAGFKHANGKLIFTMDADLQDDPAEIPSFITKINDGYDLVSGWKYRRRDPLTKKIPSKFFNWLTAKTTGVNIHDSNCGFKCYRKELLDKVHIYGDRLMAPDTCSAQPADSFGPSARPGADECPCPEAKCCFRKPWLSRAFKPRKKQVRVSFSYKEFIA